MSDEKTDASVERMYKEIERLFDTDEPVTLTVAGGCADGDDEDFCPKSASGCHEPDGKTLSAATGYDVEAEEGIVFDVTCRHCGKSGSGRIPTQEILW